MYKSAFFAALTFILLSVACTEQVAVDPNSYHARRALLPESLGDTSAYLIADTIIYDVVVQNPDSTDEWTTHCLSRVDHHTLADMVFDGIYSGKLKAHHYLTGTPLSVGEVKAMEGREGNERRKFAKMQFEELWYLDQKTLAMHKKIIAIMLAYEINGKEGRYRAGIKVHMP